MQSAAWLFRDQWDALFTDDPEVMAIVARILPLMTAAYCLTGPQVMLVNYFQAISDARRTALLGLGRTYLLLLPSTALLPMVLGETGIWLARPCQLRQRALGHRRMYRASSLTAAAT
ncbi:hypothetical protein K1X15_10880 [Devosia salina]|uniref:Uncharacterized protein n=1 Tax=Devosia salina TaxID=2860336 RepID=A0ABX8WCL0_9HYPH|nr:hypothetical protein K1X15_10880 [Devosia salina]